MTYLGYHFTIEPKELGAEILLAELGEKPFESFVETQYGLVAYIKKEAWYPELLEDLFVLKSAEFTSSYHVEEIDQVNWNEEWEKNFQPIDVGGICYVRAPFHDKTDAAFDIVIEPKMSFGTGHHETTHLMIEHLLEMDVLGLQTLDMGCGTGILAIVASLKGSGPIDAIDIDSWSYLNALENAARNNCNNITVIEGDAAVLEGKKYHLIMANINRNILLEDLPAYGTCLEKGGLLLLSGFYEEDVAIIDEKCTSLGLKLAGKKGKNNWVALKYVL
jgi:ribosomal protein L11 methyltransferase